jgi:hypothetical protein
MMIIILQIESFLFLKFASEFIKRRKKESLFLITSKSKSLLKKKHTKQKNKKGLPNFITFFLG